MLFLTLCLCASVVSSFRNPQPEQRKSVAPKWFGATLRWFVKRR
jgi:hypothetical protein